MLPETLNIGNYFIFYTKKGRQCSFDSKVKTKNNLTVNNCFKDGFEIDYENRFDNLAAIKHPDGFTFSIKLLNLLGLLKETTVIDGVFQDKLALSPEYGLISERTYNTLSSEVVTRMEIGRSYSLLHKKTRECLNEFIFLGNVLFLNFGVLNLKQCVLTRDGVKTFDKKHPNTFLIEREDLSQEFGNEPYRNFNPYLIPVYDLNNNFVSERINQNQIQIIFEDGDFIISDFFISSIQKVYKQLENETRRRGFIKALKRE